MVGGEIESMVALVSSSSMHILGRSARNVPRLYYALRPGNKYAELYCTGIAMHGRKVESCKGLAVNQSVLAGSRLGT